MSLRKREGVLNSKSDNQRRTSVLRNDTGTILSYSDEMLQ